MIFKIIVIIGICKVIVVNGDGKNVSIIGYGEIYKLDFNKKVMLLSIVFSNCFGVIIVEVEVKVGIGGICFGDNLDGDFYVVGLNIVFEIWGGDVDMGVKLFCKMLLVVQEVIIINGVGIYLMMLCIVVVNGKSLSDVIVGDVMVLVIFVVIYF